MTGPARCNTISWKLQCPNSIAFFPSCRVVLNASALPDPREVDYDVLLSCVSFPLRPNLVTDTGGRCSRILSHLDLYGVLLSPVDRMFTSYERFPTQWNLTIQSFSLLLEANIPPAGTGYGRLIEALVGSIVRILNDWYVCFPIYGDGH